MVEFAGSPLDAPSDASTRARVLRSVVSHGPSTAAELGQRLALTPAAVRRHLDHLVEDGVLETVARRPAGARGRGRPARAYRVTEAGREHLHQEYDDLAAQALRFLAETGGEEAVTEFARRRMAFIQRDYAQVRDDDPDLTPAEALAHVLNRGGYAASVRPLPIGDQLCQQHCPVSHVAHEFPQLCEAETEAISQVLGTHVQRLATIAHGDGVCTTVIPDPPAHRTTRPSTSTSTSTPDQNGASS